MKRISFANIIKKISKALSQEDTKNPPRLEVSMSLSSSANETQDSPPAYTPTNALALSKPGTSSSTKKYQAHPIISCRSEIYTDNDLYAFLRKFDTVFLIDDSGSMWGQRWRETRDALSQLLDIVLKYDDDGVDFYFINHKTNDKAGSDEPWKAGTGYRNVTCATGTSRPGEQLTVEEIFKSVQPSGGTLTGMRLDKILSRYLRKYEEMVHETDDETCLKPLNIIVMTDGVAQDHPKQYIVPAAQRLDKVGAPIYQVGIQFFQIGNEQQATKALRALDDELSKTQGCRDIVDTTTSGGSEMTGERLLKALQGGVDKHWDSKNA